MATPKERIEGQLGLSGHPLAPIPREAPQVPDHELVRRIGMGSYGEVWLARNVFGQFRAVKVVYRDRFSDERPYEREFSGIQKFEPLSRTHQGLVQVLQIGRKDAEGYFYYVMELADDAMIPQESGLAKVEDRTISEVKAPRQGEKVARAFDVENYVPRSLQYDLKLQHRLSAEECVQLGLSLSLALGHLHRHGLIHRDVKPSNIIFVHGVPKLADIGLVTEYADANSFVGTEGFIPPEGPNSPQADLYGLGKVLYEASMGKDRHDFPEPFTALQEQSDFSALLELNAVLLKACATEIEARYQSAEEMHVDLALLQSGDSVRRKHTLERRLARLKRVSAIGAAVTLAAAAALLWQQSEASRMKKLAIENAALAQKYEAASAVATRAGIAEREQRIVAQQERDRAKEAQNAEHQQRKKAEASDEESQQMLYGAQMNLAQAAWDQNGIERVRRLLTETASYPDRGFEWYYWQRQTHLSETYRVDTSGNYYMAIAPDGQRVIGSTGEETAKVWNLPSGKVAFILNVADAHFTVLAYSPNGQLIATACDSTTVTNRTATIWDAASGQKLQTFFANGSNFRDLAVSPKGDQIVAGFWDNTAKIFDVSSGKMLKTLYGHSDYVTSVTFSAKGTLVAAGARDGLVKVWDVSNGTCIQTLGTQGATITSLAFSLDSKVILTGNDDGLTEAWDISAAREIFMLPGHSSRINSIAFSSDARRVLTGSLDGTAKVWDAMGRQEVNSFKGHRAGIWNARFSSDEKHVITASYDGTVRVWDVEFGSHPLTLKGPRETVYAAAFSPDGKRIVTGSGGWENKGDCTGRVWDAASGRQLFSLDSCSNWIDSVSFSPDGRWIATGSFVERTATLWDASNGKELRTLTTNWGMAVAFSPDNHYLLTGGFDGVAKLWELPGGKEVRSITAHTNRIHCVAFSATGRKMVTAGDDATAKIWETATGKELCVLRGHLGGVFSVAFSPDEKMIATASNDETAKLWETTAGRELLTLRGHSDNVNSIAFSPDGRRIVTGSNDRTIKVWDVSKGREFLILNAAYPQCVVFSPDGQRILAGCADRTAQIWQAATPEQVTTWALEDTDR